MNDIWRQSFCFSFGSVNFLIFIVKKVFGEIYLFRSFFLICFVNRPNRIRSILGRVAILRLMGSRSRNVCYYLRVNEFGNWMKNNNEDWPNLPITWNLVLGWQFYMMALLTYRIFDLPWKLLLSKVLILRNFLLFR